MLKVEHTLVSGWEATIRGMRNPLNSWERSDSVQFADEFGGLLDYHVGDNDLNLMKKLSNSGNDHAKFLRMIHVTVDVTAPLYWWKEADQYKVGTTTNSCSTMHKIQAKEFVLDDFSTEHLTDDAKECCSFTIGWLNHYRRKFLETKDKSDWWQMIQLLPSSYNQKRTWDLNYQVLKNIYHARKNHKLDEWHTLCDWIETLPYAKELILGE
jgi:hypothetical protein